MKKGDGASDERPHNAAIQVICLGAGGGPNEDSATGFLVRATSSKWAKNSVLAVDAGTHLSAITKILEKDFPPVAQHTSFAQQSRSEHEDVEDSPSPTDTGSSMIDVSSPGTESSFRSVSPQPIITTLGSGPFAGLPFPHASARANAVHVVREHVSTYLITHPHLDHLSGFVINTAAFHNTTRPKRLAALPFTVNSIKTHIFNDIIWPNLTDEDGGVGFVTFQRLAEGGNIALGEGHGRGYIEVCDGLGVKGFKVSHGHCMQAPSHVHRGSSVQLPDTAILGTATGPDGRSLSISAQQPSQPGTPLFTGHGTSAPAMDPIRQCVIDSSAYFIRTESERYGTSSSRPPPAREILIFGDVEPDSLSLNPRTAHVWAEAAPKIAAGVLKGVFIECSYTDAQGDAVLFGHLAPRHLISELQSLADMVRDARRELEREREEYRKARKRKRVSIDGFLSGNDDDSARRRSRSRPARAPPGAMVLGLSAGLEQPHPGAMSVPLLSPAEHAMRDYLDTPMPSATPTPAALDPSQQPIFPQLVLPSAATSSTSFPHVTAPAVLDPNSTVSAGAAARLAQQQLAGPLKGLKVIVIHVKDTHMDGRLVGEAILAELEAHERRLAEAGRPLGCEFIVSKHGGSYWF